MRSRFFLLLVLFAAGCSSPSSDPPMECAPELPAGAPGASTLATPDGPRIWALSANDEYIFWVVGGINIGDTPLTVKSMPLHGGSIHELLSLEPVWDIVADDHGVYVSGWLPTQEPVVFYAPQEGTGATELNRGADLFDLVLTCDWVYGYSNEALQRVSRTTGELETLAPLSVNGNRPHLAFDGHDLYAVDRYDVIRLDADGNQVATLATNDNFVYCCGIPIVVDDEFVYVARELDNDIQRITKDGSTSSVLATLPGGLRPTTLAVDTDALYVSGYGGGGDVDGGGGDSLFRVSKSDGAVTPLVPGAGWAGDMQSNASGLHYMNGDGVHSVFR